MTTPSPSSLISLRHIFGLKGDVRDNLHFLDESVVVYPAGSSVVLYHTEKKTQRFLPLATSADAPGSGDISAMAMCNVAAAPAASGGAGGKASNSGGDTARLSRGKLLAVAERGDGSTSSSSVGGRVGGPIVSVFDLQTLKRRGKAPLHSPEVSSTEFVCLAFSPDGKYLLTQGGAPDWTLINWQFEKGKAMQMARVSNQSGAAIHQVSFCPSDPSVVCVSGNGILRFLHLEQSEFKSIPFSMGKREPQNYLSHAWIDDRILVGTDSGDILVFENAEFRGVLESSPAGGKSIDCIATYSKGFVIGMDEGYLMTFERDDKELYKYSRSFQIDGNFVKVKSLAIAPSEENCVATLENNQAYVLGLSHSDLLKSDELSFEPLAMPFHHMAITGLDVCVRKPLVVTCGMDRSVRVWNYASRVVEVTRFFNEQPHSVAFHPSGLQLLVGFSDSLRLLHILMDDVVPVRDFAIKSCREVQFAHGGQYFAAANGSVIQVFATYTCEMLGSFSVHKAKVRSLAWSADDSTIISAGMDGCVYSTRIKSGEHVAIAKHKCNYTSAVTTADGRVYAVGSDRHLKVLHETTLAAELNCGVVLTQLCVQTPRPPLKDRFLFAGSDTGLVRVFPLPVEGKCYDQQVHCGAVTRLRCSPDDNYLFSVGEDGCFAMFALESKRDAGSKSRHGLGAGGLGHGEHSLAWAEEILVNRGELEEKLAILSDLQHKVQELMTHNDTTLALKDLAYKEKLRETTDKFNAELEADRARYSALESDKDALEKSYALKVEQLNAMQRSKLDELNAHHQFKKAQEGERLAELQARFVAQRAEWEAQLAKQEEECASERAALAAEYEAKISEARRLKLALLMDRESIRAEMGDATQLIESDADAEIDDIKLSYDKKLTSERLTKLCLKDENAILKRKFASLREDITENLDDLGRMRDKQSALYDTIDTLEKDIKGHVKEIKERESTIDDKRQRIFELRKKNQELEKFKFVLDYKITELKRQIQPRKQEMKQLNEQITEMEKELKNYKKESADLQLDVTELKLKYNGMDANIAKEVRAREEVAARLSHFKTELHEVFQDIEDQKKLKDGVKRLFQRHVQTAAKRDAAALERGAPSSSSSKPASAPNGGGASGSDADSSAHAAASSGVDDVHNDYQRQRHYLERSIDSHNAKCKKELRVHVKEHTRIMQENIALTKEVNQLRREKYHILLQQKQRDAGKRAPTAGAASATGLSGAGATGGRGGRLSRSLTEGLSSSPDGAAGGAAGGAGHVDETEVAQEQIRALKKQLAMLEHEYADLVHQAGGASASPSSGVSASATSARRSPAGLALTDKLPQIHLGAAGRTMMPSGVASSSSPGPASGAASSRAHAHAEEVDEGDLADVREAMQRFDIGATDADGDAMEEEKSAR